MEHHKRPREALHKSRCLDFIKKLRAADTLAMFHHPVRAEDVPGYYDVIAQPMDLATIAKNIEENKYHSDAQVEDDVVLMISNALEFNPKESAWYQLARRLRKDYIALAREVGLEFDADAAFIPAKKVKDDESTLRKAERHNDERLEQVLGDLEKDKDIPLEELRAMYARKAEHEDSGSARSSSMSVSGESSADDEEDVSDSSSASSSFDSSGSSSRSASSSSSAK